jgi:type II secretory pathway component PulL
MVADLLACASVVAMAALTANPQEISTMGIRTDGLHRRLMMIVAALVGCSLMSSPAAAQGTPEQRAACENDAMRLCGDYVPDERRITACMSAKRCYLSRSTSAAASSTAA